MIRPGTSVSKKTNVSKLTQPNLQATKQAPKMPKFEDFLKTNDWVGAIAMLDLEKHLGRLETKLWLAYCYFHNGQYKKALALYNELIRKPNYDKNIHLYKALCLYATCSFEEAKNEALKGPEGSLQVRLLYHISHKLQDDSTLMAYHHKLADAEEDQLCLSAVHYLRGHYDDCIEIYKRLNLENRGFLAINVYLALCYYKQEFYEISQDVVQKYTGQYPDSIVASNLKACNLYQIYGGAEAEEELKKLEKRFEGGDVYEKHDLLRHNLSVFRNGENALKVFPPLSEIYPEAKLNLIIHHVKKGEIETAYKMVKDIEPISPKEYTLKGVVMAIYGQAKNSEDLILRAQQYFQLIGTSATECDTVAGRQCIASFLFLKKQYEDVLIYLKTIKDFMASDDDFNWNYGMALAAVNKFAEAEEALVKVNDENYRSEYTYNAWLAKCYIMNSKPELAWNLYLEMDTSNNTLMMLQLIGNECFKIGHYYFAIKAFDILERLDNEDYSQAKTASAVGVFKDFLLNKAPIEQFEETVQILKNSPKQPSIEHVLKIFDSFLQEE